MGDQDSGAAPLASAALGNRRQRGFSLFEFGIVAVVLCILLVVFLDRALNYQEYAERTAMELTIVNIRSGLRLRVAELITQDRLSEIGKLVDENPVRWLERPPTNYLGELALPVSKALPSGNWYFDSARRELVYLPRDNRYSSAQLHDRKETIRFQVMTVRKALGKVDRSESRVEWVTLARTNP
jgi:type II secretory pathway pseudopilin PulG